MFATRLKQIRKKNKVTQVELANHFNVSQGTVGNWETGKREPDFTTINKLAEYFNVSIDYLLGKEPLSENEILAEGNPVTLQLLNLVDELDDEEKELLMEQAMFIVYKKKQGKKNTPINE